MTAPRKASFAPVVAADTRLLVLGSLPGERSLAAGRYYAHPQNQFWRLTGAVIDRDLVPLSYETRLAALLEAGIGLWDVIATATRPGSTDNAIRDVTANDLTTLVARLPELRAVAFNGTAAARIGVVALADCPIPHVTLPSSSPLHTIGFEAKRPAWLELRRFLAEPC